MPLITSLPIPSKSKNPQNLAMLVKDLRRYTKKSIIKAGVAQLWGIHHHRADNPHLDMHYQLVNAYGPKIILLGMATANNYRNNDLTAEEFYAICHDYLGLHDSINSSPFIQQEAESLLEFLKAEKKGIPENYLNIDILKKSCSELFVSRKIRAQHRDYHATFEELYRAFYIFSRLNSTATTLCHKVFGIEPLHFVRSAFALYALGNAPGMNGYINFKNMNCPQSLINKWNIDQDTCRLVASKISYNESFLREEWYTKVLGEHEFYQPYVPDPLYKHPIIHLDSFEAHMEFLMPAPAIFLRSLTNAWFAPLIEQNIVLGSELGDVMEKHIEESLEYIFGKNCVSKIPRDDHEKRADFHIELHECDLIIEMKIGVGSDEAQSIMKPKEVSEIWTRLYGACEQCASSIKKYKNPKRPIIAIVLIGDHITAEAIPFQSFAERSGLFAYIGIDSIEFISWNALENSLSRTSVSKFVQCLSNKWKPGKKMTIEDLMILECERGELV